MEYPKVLIVSRLNWDDNSNSNTLTNLFDGYDPDKIARIYIETQKPNTKCCKRFYQISEVSLVRKLFLWRTKTGSTINSENEYVHNLKSEKKEKTLMSFVRRHRSFVFTILRDILWSFGGWKTKELKSFILEFNPDVIWLDGSPIILMNKLNNYVSSIVTKPSVTFLMDDVYTYKSTPSLIGKVYHFFLRRHVKKTVRNASHVFVASEKMKYEYDQIFSVQSTFLPKGVSQQELLKNQEIKDISTPIKLVYLGNVLIGRFDSLVYLAEAIRKINIEQGVKYELFIYTGDYVSEKDRSRILLDDHIHLCPPVPYEEVKSIMRDCDIMVFVEALTGKLNKIARLSFSTKIVDYISSGKCIFTIGPSDSAPIEYLRDHNISLVSSTEEEVYRNLLKINSETLKEYSTRVREFAIENHNKSKIQESLYRKIIEVAKSN